MVPRSGRVHGTKATILVVDDSPAMLRYLRLILENDSYQVETASNGADALLRIRQGSSCVLVLMIRARCDARLCWARRRI